MKWWRTSSHGDIGGNQGEEVSASQDGLELNNQSSSSSLDYLLKRLSTNSSYEAFSHSSKSLPLIINGGHPHDTHLSQMKSHPN
ncbi:hypothetical protein HAX54_023137 [Datura stramonium]|uniref:Uncharacterized protein n=1 Tax=Datura stramonium TaxID=4076 RepID=A0ABS8S4R4_DATST|nr:hypothetical protein [Datura stramonium]